MGREGREGGRRKGKGREQDVIAQNTDLCKAPDTTCMVLTLYLSKRDVCQLAEPLNLVSNRLWKHCIKITTNEEYCVSSEGDRELEGSVFICSSTCLHERTPSEASAFTPGGCTDYHIREQDEEAVPLMNTSFLQGQHSCIMHTKTHTFTCTK